MPFGTQKARRVGGRKTGDGGDFAVGEAQNDAEHEYNRVVLRHTCEDPLNLLAFGSLWNTSTLHITRVWAALFAKKAVLLYIYHRIEQGFYSLDYSSAWR